MSGWCYASKARIVLWQISATPKGSGSPVQASYAADKDELVFGWTMWRAVLALPDLSNSIVDRVSGGFM